MGRQRKVGLLDQHVQKRKEEKLLSKIKSDTPRRSDPNKCITPDRVSGTFSEIEAQVMMETVQRLCAAQPNNSICIVLCNKTSKDITAYDGRYARVGAEVSVYLDKWGQHTVIDFLKFGMTPIRIEQADHFQFLSF